MTLRKKPRNTSQLTVGFDPEMFLHDGVRYTPACGLIGGTKEKPIPFGKDWEGGFSYHEDNVCAEFSVPPATSPKQALDYLRDGINFMRNEVVKPKGLSIKYVGQAPFTREALSVKGANDFGCVPDFDAYEGGMTPRKVDTDLFKNYRFAGGHIHLGGPFRVPPFVIALLLDIYLVWCKYKYDRTLVYRNKWYGRPGIFRPKDYGLEYRSLSNRWLCGKDSRESVIYAIFDFGNRLLATSPNKVRSALEAVDWFEVQSILTEDFLGEHTVYDSLEEHKTIVSKKLGWNI